MLFSSLINAWTLSLQVEVSFLLKRYSARSVAIVTVSMFQYCVDYSDDSETDSITFLIRREATFTSERDVIENYDDWLLLMR